MQMARYLTLIDWSSDLPLLRVCTSHLQKPEATATARTPERAVAGVYAALVCYREANAVRGWTVGWLVWLLVLVNWCGLLRGSGWCDHRHIAQTVTNSCQVAR